MSDNTTQQRAPGFVWLLGAFAGFAVLSMILNGIFGGERQDPREQVRLDNKAEIAKAQSANVEKLGLVVGKSADTLAKGLALVKSTTPTKSTMVVPGSPTQLQQAAAAAPAAKPATAPAAPAAPAPAPAK